MNPITTGSDVGTTDPVVPSRVTWTPGFHGAIHKDDLDAWSGTTIRDVALGRRAIGAGHFATLTDLPVDGQRAEPTGRDGRLHVGVNGAATAPTDRVIPPGPAAGESLEDYIAGRLEDAEVLVLPNRGRGYAVAKRTLDLVVGGVLLLLALPVIAVLAVVIRLDSPGPAIFRQTRVTRGGRTFRFYKFRTMYVDARERFPELYAYDFTDSEFSDAYYKLADDPRNTRVGRWLRRTTLDELPNLFNVLFGDLSLVGPRPELPELVRYYTPEELACFFTKAGLTGLAQVAGRSLLTVRERLTLDVRYVAHQTFLLDLRILWRTVLVVVAGRGAF